MSLGKILLAIVVVVCLTAVMLVFLMRSFDYARYTTPDSVIQTYLMAMRSKNKVQILDLTLPKNAAVVEVEYKLALYGGEKLENVRVDYQVTENPYFMRAYLHADAVSNDGVRKEVEDLLHLERQGQRWFLVLGYSTNMPVTPPQHDMPPMPTQQ